MARRTDWYVEQQWSPRRSTDPDEGLGSLRVLTIAVLATIVVLIAAGVVAGTARAQEATYTGTDVEVWVEAYAAEYATPAAPYAWLVTRSLAVASCESGRFDPAVINNARRGRFGEIGVFQFMPGPRSIFWGTPTAAAGWDMFDPEANVAGAVFLISRGYGPRHWSCWWY